MSELPHTKREPAPGESLAEPAWPLPDEEILAALKAAYRDGSWGRYHGPHTGALAEALCAEFHCEHALLTCSGTMAVELALRGVGVRSGDEVVLAGYDFPGNFRAIEAIGARPVLVDIDPANWCLDPGPLEELAGAGGNIKAVLVSHLHGGLAPMSTLCTLARRHGWFVVEDACQAPGAVIEGRSAGSWGDVGVLSFGGSKLLTAGRGGALVTSDPAVLQRAKIFAERGNNAFPLSELQAAVLLPQLEKLAERNTLRRSNVSVLEEALREVAELLVPLTNRTTGEPAYYKVAWRWAAHEAGTSREQFLTAMQAEGVPVDAGFRGFGERSERRCRKWGPLLASRTAASQTVLLHHPVLLQPGGYLSQVANSLAKGGQRLATWPGGTRRRENS